MDGVDELLKLEKLLKIAKEDAEKEIEDAEALAREELREFEKKMRSEFEAKKRELEDEFESFVNRQKKVHESRKALIASQKRSSLRAELLNILKNAVVEILSNSEDGLRKKYLEWLLDKLKEQSSESMILVCSERDLDLVRDLYDGEIEVGDVKNGLMLKSKDGRYRIVADVSDLFEEISDLMMEIIDERVGGLE